MSHSVSVFIFIVDAGDAPVHPSSWNEVADLISERWHRFENHGITGGMVVSTSRNWWHQHLLYLMCEAYEVRGLEFAAQEVARLDKTGLQAAEAALEQLFALLESGQLAQKRAMFKTYEDIVGSRYRRALQRARAACKIEQYDAGFDAAVSFFTWLKSLRATVAAALRQERSLLFVMPSFDELNGSFEAAK